MTNYKYKILQLPIESDYIFMNYDFAKKHGFDLMDYKKVYSGEEEARDVDDLVNYLFEKFNVNHPDDFKGHSMSVSDIVLVEENQRGNTAKFEYAHYCDSFGWKMYAVWVQTR